MSGCQREIYIYTYSCIVCSVSWGNHQNFQLVGHSTPFEVRRSTTQRSRPKHLRCLRPVFSKHSSTRQWCQLSLSIASGLPEPCHWLERTTAERADGQVRYASLCGIWWELLPHPRYGMPLRNWSPDTWGSPLLHVPSSGHVTCRSTPSPTESHSVRCLFIGMPFLAHPTYILSSLYPRLFVEYVGLIHL